MQVLETALTLTALPAAPDGFEVGSLVEVQHQDEGLLGAWSMLCAFDESTSLIKILTLSQWYSSLEAFAPTQTYSIS